MNRKELELRIPADVRYLSLVRRGIRSMAESMGFARPDVADVEIAVSEAVTNSVQHGGCSADASTVVVRCTALDDYIVVEIEDESRAGLPPMVMPSAECTDEHGRGILMMQALMDSFEGQQTPQGLRVRMGKHLAHQR